MVAIIRIVGVIVVFSCLLYVDGDEFNEINMVPYVLNQEILKTKTPDKEYVNRIRSMVDAFNEDVMNGRMVVETGSLIDTKYRTWKRNGDLINSLLALPKAMIDAGR